MGKTAKERHTVPLQDPASFSSGTVPADSVFVGRDHQLAFLTVDARRALEEGVGAVLACGEEGIGKTRLMNKLGVSNRNAEVVRARELRSH